MDKILTIIVPTYNMEKYLDKCLTSLILQDQELMKQLEVLVVIDGATDGSSEIAHGYEKKYPDTFRVIDKENGNYGSCVNRGLKEATGKYIKILDADDWFETPNFDIYISRLCTTEADLVLTDWERIYQDRKGVKVTCPFDDSYRFVIDSAAECVAYMGTCMMYNITIRTDSLRTIEYKQSEGISYTDTEFVFFSLIAAKTVQYFKLNVYKYLCDREGQTMDINVMKKNIKSLESVTLRLINTYVMMNKGCLTQSKNDILEAHVSRMYDYFAKIFLFLLPPSRMKYKSLRLVDNDYKRIPHLYQKSAHMHFGEHWPLYYLTYWREKDRDARYSLQWQLLKHYYLIKGLLK